MEQVSQKQAVVNEVKAILGTSFDETKSARELLTKDQIKTICANITTKIIAGEIFYGSSKELPDVSSYVPGMVSNHLRKAKELNGGASYEPKNGGGKRDQQVLELSKLLKTLPENSEEFNQVVEAIAARKLEIGFIQKERKPKKLVKPNPINMEMLPESLRILAESLINV